MRSIMLHIFDDECLEARLQVALDLGRQFDGHVSCVQAPLFDLGLAGDFYYPIAAQLASDLRKTAGEVQERIEKKLTRSDVPWDWTYQDSLAAYQLPRRAPLADIVVLGAKSPFGGDGFPAKLVSDIVSKIRAPVLVVPPESKGISLNAPAMVAWNGTAEGAHALRAAVPMLAKASQVHVLTVTEVKDVDRFDIPPIGAAKYLARHGIEAEVIELKREGKATVAETLMEAATNREGAYLVMGAYGHSRFRERILGGVTRDMLTDPEIPLLLCH